MCTSWSTVHDNDVDVAPLLSLQNAAPGDSGDGEDCDGVDHDIPHPRLHDDTQSDDNHDDSADILEAILGHMSQRGATSMMGWMSV